MERLRLRLSAKTVSLFKIGEILFLGGSGGTAGGKQLAFTGVADILGWLILGKAHYKVQTKMLDIRDSLSRS